nr:MAG TPA: hypothetical protein [Caudoviricetes sp.]
MNFNIFDYDFLDALKTIILILLIVLLVTAISYSTLYNLSEKNKKEYIDKGYEETIVIIDNYGKTKEILIKKDSKLLDMLKKELEKEK